MEKSILIWQAIKKRKVADRIWPVGQSFPTFGLKKIKYSPNLKGFHLSKSHEPKCVVPVLQYFLYYVILKEQVSRLS
jgi:hypothetical protein